LCCTLSFVPGHRGSGAAATITIQGSGKTGD